MDTKIKLLKEFYSSMDMSQMKIECHDYDWNLVKTFEKLSTIDYIESGEQRHAYRVSNVSLFGCDLLLEKHIEGAGNVCCYFDTMANNVLCFNLDVNTGTDTVSFEMQSTVIILRDYLRSLGMEPLIIQTGKGFHCWLRFSEPIPNRELDNFMLMAKVMTRITMKSINVDHNKVNFCRYPDNNETQSFSLRLAGSRHIRTKEFCSIIHGNGTDLLVLAEEHFWQCLADHMERHTISIEHFREQVQRQHSLINDMPSDNHSQ